MKNFSVLAKEFWKILNFSGRLFHMKTRVIPLTYFHLAEASLSAFLWLYTRVCSCPKISRNAFFIYLVTFLVLILQLTYFICTTWKRKQTMEEQPNRAHEGTKSKQKQSQVTSHSNWPRAIVRLSPPTMQWYH